MLYFTKYPKPNTRKNKWKKIIDSPREIILLTVKLARNAISRGKLKLIRAGLVSMKYYLVYNLTKLKLQHIIEIYKVNLNYIL